ncbi:MAG: LysM peptidoglycan-binding domain-containing protein [Brevinematia bacterium]
MTSFTWSKITRIVFAFGISLLICVMATGEYVYYRVKKGDTFFSLSRKFNVDVWVIQKENSISTLREGDTIRIPLRQYITYTVNKSDTLFSLAKRFGTSIEEIISANSLSSIDIKVGQRLVIPSGRKVVVNHEQNRSVVTRDDVYVVKSGDTLFSISRKTGVSMKELLKLNKLGNDSVIKPGMIIVLKKGYSQDSDKVARYSDGFGNKLLKEANCIFPVNFATYTNNHSGRFLELILSKEDTIKAVMDGEVVFVGSFSVFGRTVIVKHSEELYSIYGMVSNERVKVGDKLRKGDVIGIPIRDSSSGRYIAKFSFIIGNRMIAPSEI